MELVEKAVAMSVFLYQSCNVSTWSCIWTLQDIHFQGIAFKRLGMQRLSNNTGQCSVIIRQQPSENLTILSKSRVQPCTRSMVTTQPRPCQPGFEKSLLTNLTTVKIWEQTLHHVLHTAEFADISGHMMCCRKVYAPELYDNSYFGYNKEFLWNWVTKVNQKEN